MNASWHERWDRVVLAALGGLHLLLSLWLLPSGLLGKYPRFAELLRAGRLSGEEVSPASPLYLLIHLTLPPGPVRWLQCAVAVAAMVLIYKVGRRVRDPLTGLLCAGLFALCSPVLVYGAALEPDLLLMAACLLGVWAGPGVLSRFGHAALFGAALGLAISLRPTAGLVALALLAGLAVGALRARTLGTSWRPLLLSGALLVLVGVAAPLGVRLLVPGKVEGTMSPGAAFYDGNRPESLGLGVTNPWLVKAVERQGEGGRGMPLPDPAHALYRRFARLDGGAAMTLPEIQRYWAAKSTAFAREEPAAFVSLLLRKTLFLLAGAEYHDIHEVRRVFVSLGALPLVSWRWICLMGLAGGLLAARRKAAPWWLWVYGAAGAAGLIAFSVVTRYALILLPALVLFAGLLLREALAVRGWKPAARVGVALALAFLPGFAPPLRWDARIQERVLEAHRHLEQLTASRGDLAAATASYVEGQSHYPFLPSIMDPRGLPFESREVALAAARAAEGRGLRGPADAYLQAALWRQAGDCGRALPLARRAAKAGFFATDDSRFLDAHLLVAECLIEAGDQEGAMAAVLASLEAHPATADGLAMALAGAQATGLASDRVAVWGEQLHRIHDRLSADWSLLEAHRTWGDTPSALEVARRLHQALPEAAVVHYQVAILHARAGEAAQAFDWLQRARASDPGLPLALAPFREALDHLIATDPRRREVWVARVDQAAQAGRFREGYEVATRAGEHFPGDREIEQLALVMELLAQGWPEGGPQ